MGLIPELYQNRELDYRNYIPTLLSLCLEQGFITQEELSKIFQQSYQLLSLQVDRYTSKESTSLPEETANKLLQSMLYIIGLELQIQKGIPQQLQYLMNQPLLILFNNGLARVETMTKKAYFYHHMVKNTILDLPISAYQTVINSSFNLFFKKYNAKYSALDSVVWLEYPLSDDLIDMSGIQYILEYLQRLYFENTFCGNFPLKAIKNLLINFDQNYQELIFNLFDLILINASGLILLNKNPLELTLTKSDFQNLQELSKTFQTPLQMQETLYQRFLTQFNITDSYGGTYLYQGIRKFAASYTNLAKKNSLLSLFTLSKKKAKISEEIIFVDTDPMADKAFTALYEELCSCRYTKDKINLLQSQIKSLKDMIDMLSTDCLLSHEYKVFFEELTLTELNLLISNTIFKDIPKEDDFIAQVYDYELAKGWHLTLLKTYEHKRNHSK